MLIAFSVANFKSIRDLQTLSMEASTDGHLEWSNVIVESKQRLLKTAVIYGPNASGKSNLILAMAWFRDFITSSSKDSQVGEKIKTTPFRLSSVTENTPSHFEIEFRWEHADYRYGFDLTAEKIEAEWLFRKTSTKSVMLFERENDEIKISPSRFKEGKGLESRTRSNALFLSVCAQFNGNISGKVMEWMRQFRDVSGLHEGAFFGFTAGRLQEASHKESILELAQSADFNIQQIRSEVEELTANKLPPQLPADIREKLLSQKIMTADIKTAHKKLDADGNLVELVEFDLKTEESSGTRKFIALSGPLTHTLEEGSILIVDELEAMLHPKLTQAILDLFHGPANKNNAQLICTTHDVSLLESDRFRRDQVWFCEKDSAGSTDLFTLADINSNLVRPNSKFSKQYMQGMFGATPRLSHFAEAAANATK